MTRPNTTCFASSQSVTTVVIKNWEPFVSSPAFAIDNRPENILIFQCDSFMYRAKSIDTNKVGPWGKILPKMLEIITDVYKWVLLSDPPFVQKSRIQGLNMANWRKANWHIMNLWHYAFMAYQLYGILWIYYHFYLRRSLMKVQKKAKTVQTNMVA